MHSICTVILMMIRVVCRVTVATVALAEGPAMALVRDRPRPACAARAGGEGVGQAGGPVMYEYMRSQRILTKGE